MSLSYEDIKRVNTTLNTTPIKGKEYVQVNERIRAFRELFPEGFITTEVLKLDGGMVVIRATVGMYFYDENSMTHPKEYVLATGTAYEKEGATQINRTSYIENCETSAVGRALGMLGIGIANSVASAEEVEAAIVQQDDMDAEAPIDEAHWRGFEAELKKAGNDPKEILERYEVGKPSELTYKKMQDIRADLRKKK